MSDYKQSEKLNEQTPLWHDVNERPEENRELLCEWAGEDGVWHDTAFYSNRNEFWNGFTQIQNVVRWCYIDEIKSEPEDKGEISDGYHTFNELYYYRMLYNAAFFNMLPKEWVHKSKRHNDGEECFGGGWFIVMANLPTGQISNHYELKDWDLFQVPEKEIADKWDGHTPQEAAERLHKYLLETTIKK